MKTCESNSNLVSYTLQGAGGVGGLLAVTESFTNSLPPTAYFPAYDAIRLRASLTTPGQDGNITEYADTNGTIVAHYEYNPFGGLITSSGTKANDFKFRFSTKYFDDEIYAAEGGTGLYNYGLRYLDTELGRWINRDLIGEDGGLNIYDFVWNNGINSIDPNGEFALIVGCAAVGSIITYWALDTLMKGTETVIDNQLTFIADPSKINMQKYQTSFQNQLTEIHNFTYNQAIDRYVGSLLLDGPIGYVAVESADSIVGAFKVRAIMKSGNKFKDINVTLKVSKDFMKAAGYKYVKRRRGLRVIGGYWRRKPGAKIANPTKVNSIIEKVARSALSQAGEI